MSILLLATLFGCSDYEFVHRPDDPGVDSADTGQLALCPESEPAGYAADPTVPCQVEPEIGSFVPVIEWQWSENPVHPAYMQIMAAPAVANLTDDNGDGKVDRDDVPDIVFTVFQGGSYGSAGAVVAISGSDGATLWSVIDAGGHQPYGASGVAIGDVTNTGDPRVFVSSTTGLLCLDRHGQLLWNASVPTSQYGNPALGDIDQDGVGEIVFGRSVIEADGTIAWNDGGGSTQDFTGFPVDLDGDGYQEIVTGSRVYTYDGTLLWDDGHPGWTAVGDVDGDLEPDIVKVSNATVTLAKADGTTLWTVALSDTRGGPPTIADFDGDGLAEIGVASSHFYRVIDGDGSILWENVVQDYSSAQTGSSVFDFEGDGAAEVVYADEETLWVFDGATGATEMAWTTHASGTLYEYPLIVDVDNDGSAEIVVISNDYSRPGARGVTVIGDASDSWAATRGIWNQHAYSITNVDDDGGIPLSPAPNWETWNSFRAGNSEVAVGYAQPDLRVGEPSECFDQCDRDEVVMYLPVENSGAAAAADVRVALYAKDGISETLVAVFDAGTVPPGSVAWAGPLTLTRDQFGPDGLVAKVDDDGAGGGAVAECVEGNNSRRWAAFPCGE